ncbi:response regulator GacA [Legionella steelei]|uniref:Response regulator GacA n=2 Tax=Legionella steelei TaxID=947033 RepID=A0A0W0ZCP7_9GAMM|nr:response regulator GacA [Legionella steelei]
MSSQMVLKLRKHSLGCRDGEIAPEISKELREWVQQIPAEESMMGKTVMIVDDSSFMRTILKDILNRHFAELDIIEADGETAALLQLKTKSPHLVLLDVIMNASEIEGVKLLEQIHDQYPLINVLMITSVGHASIKEQCKSLGAKGYIQKPFEDEEITSELKKYL